MLDPSMDLDFAIPFAGLPWMRTLRGHMVRGSPAAATAPDNAADDDELCQNFKAGKQCPVIGLDMDKVSNSTKLAPYGLTHLDYRRSRLCTLTTAT